LTREELIALARETDPKLPDHLKECEDCRLAWELLSGFEVSGKTALPDPPRSWIDKAAAIARPQREAAKRIRVIASLIFDSWTEPSPVGVRGTAGSQHRRIEFESKGRVLDLRAEKSSSGWSFVAQLSGTSGKTSELTCGGQTIWPDQSGLFQWSSARPPRKITIVIENELVELPDLKWTKPKSKKRPEDS